MNNKVKPALIGGVLLGLLSVIPVANICCCLWAILGGMIASYLYVKNSATPATPGDGAMIGALAGAFGAVIVLVLGIPISYATGPALRNWLLSMMENMDPQQAEMFRRQLEMSGDSIVPVIINSLILAVLLFIFSIIGGLIGTALFEKRKGGATPPPPPVTGGPGAYAP
jgi:small-conductance mechanosensitive channel